MPHLVLDGLMLLRVWSFHTSSVLGMNVTCNVPTSLEYYVLNGIKGPRSYWLLVSVVALFASLLGYLPPPSLHLAHH